MPATINRTVYFAQTGKISFNNGDWYVLPVQSANVEVTRPIEPITAFGQFSALNTAQTNFTTCKSTFKAYLGTGTSLGKSAGGGGVDSTFLNQLISNTQSGKQIAIEVGPNGYSMSGLLTNLGIDISIGAFGMCDMGFAGLGNPTLTSNTTSTTTEISTTMSLSPVTTMSVDTGSATALSGAFPTSVKFSYDLPTDTLATLGENPNASQSGSTLQSVIATKPPYKATVSVEGYGINPTVSDAVISVAPYEIGNIGVQLRNGKVTSRSFNNAAGQVSATFSYTVEDIFATLSAPALNVFNGDSSVIPSYGA